MDIDGERKRYSEDSAVDDYLLNQISKWIICDRLGLLARDLGIGQAEFSRIQAMKSAPVEQVFQVRSKYCILIKTNHHIFLGVNP